MWGRVRVKVAPAALPLSVADLKDRLVIEDTERDQMLEDFIRSAVAKIDGPAGIGVAMCAQTWTLTLDRFADEIILPGAPISAISEVRYLDADGVSQVLAPAVYRLITGIDPVRLVRAIGASWPAVYSAPAAVEIDYTLGAATPAAVSPDLVTAVAMLAGHYFENREAAAMGQVRTVPLGFEWLIADYRRGEAG